MCAGYSIRKRQLLRFLQQLLLMKKTFRVDYYNLDVIISVGYHINQKRSAV